MNMKLIDSDLHGIICLLHDVSVAIAKQNPVSDDEIHILYVDEYKMLSCVISFLISGVRKILLSHSVSICSFHSILSVDVSFRLSPSLSASLRHSPSLSVSHRLSPSLVLPRICPASGCNSD